MSAQIQTRTSQGIPVQLALSFDMPPVEPGQVKGTLSCPGGQSSKPQKEVGQVEAMPSINESSALTLTREGAIWHENAIPKPSSKPPGSTIAAHEPPLETVVTTDLLAKAEPCVGHPQNLAAVMVAITNDPFLTKRQRTDFQSALRGLAQVARRELALIPTTPDVLRELFRSILPVAHGITANRWCHIRSRVTRAIQRTGAPVMPGRSTSPITFAWAQLSEAVTTKGAKIGLSRFMRYCTGHHIEPSNVTQAVFDDFLEALRTQSLVRSPAYVHRAACVEWNTAAAVIASWPALMVTVPKNERRYSLEFPAFPESFQRDVNAYFARAANPDPFDDEALRSLRPSTVQHQRKQILEMASLLVRSGVPLEEVTDLSVLAAPDTAKRILREAQKRLGAKSPYPGAMAQLLATIAKHWCRFSSDTVAKLHKYAANTTPKSRGMTPKNQERLRQFDDTDNLLKLLQLPQRIFHRLAGKAEPNVEAARSATHALAVAILTNIPVRSENLVKLDCARHLVPIGNRRHPARHLVIEPHEIKNDEAIEAVVPPDVVVMIETYRKRYLPLICKTPTSLLFPNENGDIRYPSSFANAVCKFIWQEAGLVMNAHLFRHLAVTTYLHHHPEDVETARRILGHRSLNTTMRYYARLKISDAFRRFDAMIVDFRVEAGVGTGRTSSKIKGGR